MESLKGDTRWRTLEKVETTRSVQYISNGSIAPIKKRVIVLPSGRIQPALCASHKQAVEKGSPVVTKVCQILIF